MCGIAGILDLGGGPPDIAAVRRMTEVIRHRGPDEDGFLFRPGVGVGHRRLSIVGLADGRQPIFNEDGDVAVMFNGELFDYPEQRKALEARGHVFRTHTDTEIIAHLYEENGEDFFESLKGQFAFALVDLRQNVVLLARDRTGICPLHVSRQGDRLVFGSEIKAVLASGLVPVECDVRGLDHIFTFFSMATRRTAFAGVESIAPGHYLRVALAKPGRAASVVERRYWDLDFPDSGAEDDPAGGDRLVDEFEATFRRAVEIRLRADVPVVSYLSGGVDSAYTLAVASSLRGEGAPSFTVQVANAKLDETAKAALMARHVGSRMTVVRADDKLISGRYPDLIKAADCPVVDTSCAALWALAREVHDQGYKVALTGEGADEAFAGYAWFKLHGLRNRNIVGAAAWGAMSRSLRRNVSPGTTGAELRRIDALIGGPHAQSEFYSVVSYAGRRYYSQAMKDRLGDFVAYEDFSLDLARIGRWHPLNQSLYFGYKTQLAGLLLNHKGDRVALANSVETRYPFLDEDVIALAARVAPRWKIRGFTQDKFLLRQAAARLLPREVAARPKAMFRAPFAESFLTTPAPYVRQLMSAGALAKTGYFDVAAVRRDYERFAGGGPARQLFRSMGLTAVLATQLWHHLYLGGGLCELDVFDLRPADALAK